MSGPSRRITCCRKNVLVVCRTAKGVGTHKLCYVQPGVICSAPGELPRTIGGDLPANCIPHLPKPLVDYGWFIRKGGPPGTPLAARWRAGLSPCPRSRLCAFQKT